MSSYLAILFQLKKKGGFRFMAGCYKNGCFISKSWQGPPKQQLTKKPLPELKVSVLALE